MAALPTSLPDSARASSRSKSSFLQQVITHWQGFAPREKFLITAALAVVGVALLWWVAVAPALAVLKTAQTQRSALDAQLQQMQTLQAQAKGLQALPKVKSADAAKALEAVVKQRLGGAAQLSLAGNQATITLSNTSADSLAQFLSQARAQANALPSQARLRRSSGLQSWDGTLVLVLPAQ